MPSTIRKIPPVCLGISLVRLILGKIRFSKKHLGKNVVMLDGQAYTIFRHVQRHPASESDAPSIFVVRFKFSRLSHQANKIASIIPMLIITGYPGFHIKMYGVNKENGSWQGMYQWESEQALFEYTQSFVYRIMNKRAIQNSISSFELKGERLIDYIKTDKFQKDGILQ